MTFIIIINYTLIYNKKRKCTGILRIKLYMNLQVIRSDATLLLAVSYRARDVTFSKLREQECNFICCSSFNRVKLPQIKQSKLYCHNFKRSALQLICIIYHDFLPTPRRGSHVKLGKTHTQSSRYTP